MKSFTHQGARRFMDWLQLCRRLWQNRWNMNPWFHRWSRWLLTGLTVTTFLFVVGAQSPAAANPAKHYTDLDFPPLNEVTIPEYERFELPNGITVYLMEDHELPLVSGTALFRTGDRFEPRDKVGLASLTGSVMRSGGTVNYPPDILNQRLEQNAAAVETAVDTTAGSATFTALSENLTEVFTLFTEVIQAPAFDPQQVDIALNQTRGSIARRNDDPDDIAGREFRKLVYGSKSPYARIIEYDNLANISREDLIQFYRQSFQPNSMLLGIVGDFEPKSMQSLIEEKFGGWQSDAPPIATENLPPVQQSNSGIFFIDQPQLTQSYVQLGHLGGQFDSPDYAALSVLNGVLNGFGGRLGNEVRSRQGLAYVVYSFWSARFDYPGLFIGGGQTQSETTVPFIQSIQAELNKIRTEPVTDAELAYAKDSVKNSFVFRFQNPSQVLSRLLRYDYYNYPLDFLFQYQQAVESVSAADILRVAQTYLQPDQLVTLVVGNQAAINPGLATLDQTPIQTVDITIPDPNLQGTLR